MQNSGVYGERIVKREMDQLVANSREAAMKELLPDRQAARQARAMPSNPDVAPVSSQAALYHNWVWVLVTKSRGRDQPRPYRTPKQEASRIAALEEELDANSVFDLLKDLGSQSSQPLDSQPSTSLDTTTAAPMMPPHFTEASPTIPPFDLNLLGSPAPMSPVTASENVLLNLAPGSPVKGLAPLGIGRGARLSGQSSCSDSPMSLVSPAVSSSLALALKVRARAPMPALLDARTESSEESSDNEDMDARDNSPRNGAN